MCPILDSDGVDLTTKHKPPFEIELAYIPPPDALPWNLWWNIGLWDEKAAFHTWQPGIKNIPGVGRKMFNTWVMEPDQWEYTSPGQISANSKIQPKFESEPSAAMGGKKVYMLLQVPDEHHVRVGVKAREQDPWTLSTSFDTSSLFGRIAKFSYPALVSFQGRHVGGKGWGAGNYPTYQRFQIDYLHYQFKLSL